MGRVIDGITAWVTKRPGITLGALLAVTVALGAGMGLLGPQADSTVFLPEDSDVAIASGTLSEAFPDSAGLTNITVLHRGDVFTPEGLDHVDRVLQAALSTPGVDGRLALDQPISAVTPVFQQALGVEDLSGISQQQIDGVLGAVEGDPMLDAAIGGLSGTADGEDLAITSIKLRALNDRDGLTEIELDLADAVAAVDGPLDVRALSGATIDQESAESSSSSMTQLLVFALLVIALLLFVFFRTGSDVMLALAGLGITVLGTMGAQGILGPDGLGVIGLPNQMTSVVPIMLIGLVVDYAIQSVARYREIRAEGESVAVAVRQGLRGVLLPLGLAGGTTIISFLTNLASPIPANQDFGVVAAIGVLFGLVVMLTLMPAARALLDGRREARGVVSTPRPVSGAIPGAGPLVERIGSGVARKPIGVLAGVGVLTIGLGIAAANISTVFDTNDFLPSDGESIEDIEALDEALGGQTEVVTVLVEAELTDDRILRNLFDLSAAFSDELSRPTGAAGDITASLGGLFQDWSTDDGFDGDNYDPELLALGADLDQGLTLDPVGVQAILDRLEANDPLGFARVAVDNPDGEDQTLIQFSALTGDQDRTRQLVDDIEGLWFGDRDQVTVTSGEIIGLEVSDTMTSTQTTSIAITVLAALIVLMVFFWATEFKPMLAVIAVLPIVVVLLWVLGSMTLLGIPYNVITALITALSIGIGVDYTIHI
ncbi:MAG: MMPL family transporter, partial [Actinomycetota bacterium]